MNGVNLVNGVAVHRHVVEERSPVHDPEKHKQKMAEILVLGMPQRINHVTPMIVQVNK